MFSGGWIQSVFQYFSKAQNLIVSLSPHVRESRFENPGNTCLWYPESMKFLLVEFGILGFGIRNTAPGIRNPTKDWNLKSSTWNPESTTWNPETKLSSIPLHGAILLASLAGIFRGALFSFLPTNTWSTENNIPFPLFYLRGKWPISSCAMKCWQAKLD